MLYLDHFSYDGQRPSALKDINQQRAVVALLEKLATLESEIATCTEGRIAMTTSGTVHLLGFPEELEEKIRKLLADVKVV